MYQKTDKQGVRNVAAGKTMEKSGKHFRNLKSEIMRESGWMCC
ncbi:hypothetical protein [Sediminibacillus terrae]|nr:hypothetical protein [Sediminibacillus terrae]